MANHKVFSMDFGKVYPLLIAKAERKGRSRDEVDEITAWLTGYTREEIAACMTGGTTYGAFFEQAPAPNPLRRAITGKICGVRVEEIDDPLMQEVRYLDKLVDELARGRSMDRILRRE